MHSTARKIIRDAMAEIGFREEGRHFRHSDSAFIIEFPPGPLTVGAEPVREINEREYPTGILRVISPTDCVKDRLAAYFHWGDNQCLAQAVMVAQAQKVDWREVRRWSKAEGKSPEFDVVRRRLMGK